MTIPFLLLPFVHDLVVGFDNVFLRSAALRHAAGGSGARRLALRRAARLRLRVESLPRLAVCAVEFLLRGTNLVHVVAAERLPRPLDRRLELRLRLGREPIAPILHVLLDLVRHAVETVARIDLFSTLLVFSRMRLGVL